MGKDHWKGKTHPFWRGRRFPVVPSLDAPPPCFSCGAPLRDVETSGLPSGEGAFKGQCTNCDYKTWFDVVEGKAWAPTPRPKVRRSGTRSRPVRVKCSNPRCGMAGYISPKWITKVGLPTCRCGHPWGVVSEEVRSYES